MSSILKDLRYAFRTLVRQPRFSAVAVLTIALGIGANTAIFSVVNGVLLKPLPFEDPRGLVFVGAFSLDAPDRWGTMSVPDIEDVAALPAFEKLVGYRTYTVTITGDGDPRLAEETSVSEGILGMLGVRPQIGRDLRVEEKGPDGPRVAVVSHSFWQDQLGGDETVVGSTLEIAEIPYEVVGVAPQGFDFPDGTDIWRPDRLNTEGCGRGCNVRWTVGRIAPGVSLINARTQLTALSERLARAYPESHFEARGGVKRLQDRMVGDVETGLWVVSAAVGLVLLIACGNVAILLLVRANARQGEIAVRAALGASRGRLVRQILLESQVLAFFGTAIGTAGAYVSIGVLRELSAGTIPRIDQVTMDGSVLTFSLLVTVVVALLFGIAPAVTLTREGMTSGLRSSSRGGVAQLGDSRLRNVLLAFEVAMSVMLLTGSGLLLKTFTRMYTVSLGYETENIVRFTLSIPRARYQTLEQVASFYRTLEERIEGIPGVASVGAVYGAPLSGGTFTGEVYVAERPTAELGYETYANVKPMTPKYFETMRIPLLRGRSIEAADITGAPPVAVVNERFVAENFRDQDPIGQRVRVTASFGWADPGWTIVGVVSDIRSSGLTREPTSEIYVAQAQYGPTFMTVSVRGNPGVSPPISPIRSEVLSLDPNVPLRQIETVRDAMDRQVAPTRFYLVLVVAFAGLAVVLSAVGLYGVVAYLVSRRTREIGIRVALGAPAVGIVRKVATEGLYPALGGVALGIIASVATARVLSSLLFEVQPNDPGVLVSVSVMVLIVSCFASLLPAFRATGIDPVKVIRAD